MFHFNGQVQIAPKIISWVGMPVFIDDRERFELLKRDVFLYDCDISHLSGLTAINHSWSAFVFNFDEILKKDPHRRAMGDIAIAVQLAKFIANNHLNYSLVHTTSLDPRIMQVFYEYRVPVLQRDLQYRSTAWDLIEKHILPVFRLDSRVHRQSIRLRFLPMQKIMVAVKILNRDSMPVATAYLDNLSLNGFALFFTDRSFFAQLKLRDIAKLKMQVHDMPINVSSAIITRIEKSRGTIAVSYSIENATFIKKDEAARLSRLIYSSLRQFNHTAVTGRVGEIAEAQ